MSTQGNAVLGERAGNGPLGEKRPRLELTPQDRLDSWKEIAAYLRRGTRTVQRWELEQGLPVHRLRGRKPGGVFAYKPEVDAWWRERSLEAERAPDAAMGSGPWRKWVRMALAFLAVVWMASLIVLVRS